MWTQEYSTRQVQDLVHTNTYIYLSKNFPPLLKKTILSTQPLFFFKYLYTRDNKDDYKC